MVAVPFEKCVMSGCATPEALDQDVCRFMGSLGVQNCPGLATTASGEPLCSLPGELADVMLAQQHDAPATLVHEAMTAVVGGTLAPDRLPMGEEYLFRLTGPVRWRTVALALEEQYNQEPTSVTKG
jgi:hypothetical protein